MVQRKNSGELHSGKVPTAMGGKGALIHVVIKGLSVWSNLTAKLLLVKLLKKLMLVLTERCQNTVYWSLLHMELYSCWQVRAPMLTSTHCQQHQQWVCEYQNWTTKQWKILFSSIHLQGYRGVHASIGKDCFGRKMGTNTILSHNDMPAQCIRSSLPKIM